MGSTLRADIIVGGKADGSFYRLGSQLEQMGAMVGGISTQLISFGKESIDAYVQYEDAMLDAEVALSALYGRGSELGRVMSILDKNAKNWANSTRFTMSDVGNAISEAAHAGWDLNKIMSAIPAAMNIAQAGGMDLATGLEYLIDVSNGAQIPFEMLGTLVDYWAFGANSSSTNVFEMGEAMQKMGASAQFVKGDMAELVTMLAVLADNGAKGTEAGTLLRNTMIRLIAPTKKAAEQMDELMLSGSELDEIYANADGVPAAVELLEKAGFSAYDAEGNLKSFLTIFSELNTAVSEMTEQDRNAVLSAIFPTRTIQGALALLGSTGKMMTLYSSILANAAGYADYAGDRMESELGGTLRHFESVMNVLQTRTGESLSEDVSWVTGKISGLVDAVNNMDDAAFNGIVGGLEVVAATGPALMTAGVALKFIGAAISTLGPVGWGIAAAAGITALGYGIHRFVETWEEADFAAKFGELGLNEQMLATHFSAINSDFEAAAAPIREYSKAIGEANQKYEEASRIFSSDILTAMVTGAELTQDQQAQLISLGADIGNALRSGIENSHAISVSGLSYIFGENPEDAEHDPMFDSIMGILDEGYEASIKRAEELSGQLHDALLSAFADGHITEDERSIIQSFLREMDEEEAKYYDIENAAKTEAQRRRALEKAQSMGLDGMEYLKEQTEAIIDAQMEVIDYGYQKAMETIIAEGMRTGNDYDAELAALKAATDKKRQLTKAQEWAAYVKANRALLQDSDMAGTWAQIQEMADFYTENGYLTWEQVRTAAYDTNRKDVGTIRDYLKGVIDDLGGIEDIAQRINLMNQSGDFENANALYSLLAAYAIAYDVPGGEQGFAHNKYYSWMDAVADAAALEHNAVWSSIASALKTGNDSNFLNFWNGNALSEEYKAAVAGIVGQLAESYDLSEVDIPDGFTGISRLFAAAYKLMYDPDTSAEYTRTNPSNQYTPSQLSNLDIESPEVTATVEGDTGPAMAEIAALNGMAVYIDVIPRIGRPGVNAGAALGLGGLFAEGGRAEQASIFGEAGPEWAIPEEHTQRTAELLDAARRASGFTWPELLSRNGGMNAGSGGSYTLVYSPTIIANDANGVEQKLKDDKRELDRWLQEQKFIDRVEEYA